MNTFQAGSGFSVSWLHFWSLMVTGVVVTLVAAALVGCLIHKLNEGVFQEGATLIINILLIGMIVSILLGVLKTI